MLDQDTFISGKSGHLERFDQVLSSYLPRPPRTSDALNDTQFLVNATYSALKLDQLAFYELLNQRLFDLERRLRIFRKPEFTDTRFLGWCTVLYKTCGQFNVANKHLLLKTGLMFDDELFLIRLIRLCHSAIDELDERFERNINTPNQFFDAIGAIDHRPRRQISYTLNYVSRYAYSFRYGKIFDQMVEPIIRNRLDIAVMLPGIARIPFVTTASPVFCRIRDATLCMDDFIENNSRNILAMIETGDVKIERNIIALILSQIRALSNSLEYDKIFNLIKLINISMTEIFASSDREPFFNAAMSVSDPVEILYALERTGMDDTSTLALTAILHARVGNLVRARSVITRISESAPLNFADMSKLSRLIEYVLPPSAQKSRILQIKKRLLSMARADRDYGDENFTGRAIEIERLSTEAIVMNEYASAINLLLEEKIINIPAGYTTVVNGDNIVLLAFIQDKVTPNLLVPLIPTIIERGGKIFNLVQNDMSNPVINSWILSPQLTPNFESLILPLPDNRKLINSWTVDLESGIISCNGMNLYQGFYERISRVLKVFSVDWKLPLSKFFLELWMRQVDRLITALDGARSATMSRSVKITLVSLQSQFVPGYAMKVYAEKHDDIFSHVTISSSYENWSTNVGGDTLSTLTILNNTIDREPSLPAFGTRRNFEHWLDIEFFPNREYYLEHVASMTSIRRSGDYEIDKFSLFDRINNAKAGGSTVFCALGKIPYDLAVPYQKGPAHRDLKDWINHTVGTIKDTNNLLIIKPHPHELNYNISHKPNETFLDLIDHTISENIIILPHRGISVQDLIKHVDTFLCWNGSAIAELGSQGVSIVACDEWAAKNYPIDLMMPNDRRDYELMLRSTGPVEMHDNFPTLSSAYVAYISLAPFSIRFPYVSRSSTNTDFNRSWINWNYFSKEKLRELEPFSDQIARCFLPHMHR